eukprot:6210792-Pleurochrysis_carterae.AAC.3
MSQPFVCPLDHSFEIPLMVSHGLEWREHSFLENERVPRSLRASTRKLSVARSPVGNGSAGAKAEQGAADLVLDFGATFGQVAQRVSASTLREARVLQLDVADLSRLCRCVADLPKVHALNGRLQHALSTSFHYCDTTDNPYFVQCKSEGRAGCRKHPVHLMNVSRGNQMPPIVPKEGCSVGEGCGRLELPTNHITEGVKHRNRSPCRDELHNVTTRAQKSDSCPIGLYPFNQVREQTISV